MVKLKGSSIMEALIALVIISLSFGMASLIFVSIYKTNSVGNTFRINRILEKEAFICKNQKSFLDEEKQIEEFLVSKKIEKLNEGENLAWLKLIAYRENKLVAKHIEIIEFDE